MLVCVFRRTSATRLVMWNIDLTLVDVARVTREAYAEAFEQVTGRPLVQLASMAGRADSEIFFESLALNGVEWREELLPAFTEALAEAFGRRRALVAELGRVLAGAEEALAAVARLRGTVQTVLTGTVRANAIVKLQAFGLDRYVDFEVGGYGSEAYPKATLLRVARGRAASKYKAAFDEATTVLVGDSPRDVEAARIGGAAVIGVATGRSTEAELRSAGADAVLPDLADTAVVVQTIERLTSPRPVGRR